MFLKNTLEQMRNEWKNVTHRNRKMRFIDVTSNNQPPKRFFFFQNLKANHHSIMNRRNKSSTDFKRARNSSSNKNDSHCDRSSSNKKRCKVEVPFESARDLKMRKRAATYKGETFRSNREQIAQLTSEKLELKNQLEKALNENKTLKNSGPASQDDETQHRALICEKHKVMVLSRLLNAYDHAAVVQARYIKRTQDDFASEYEIDMARLGMGGSRYGGIEFPDRNVQNMSEKDFKKTFQTELETFEDNDNAITEAISCFSEELKESRVEVENRHDAFIADSKPVDFNNNKRKKYRD